MSYKKDEDILGMYRYKCELCDSKFLDQPSIVIHYRMSHNMVVNGNPSKIRKDAAMQRVMEYVHRRIV